MASPLRFFRKYQAHMLVFFGVILMFSFVIAPTLMEYQQQFQGQGNYRDEVAVTWKHGKVTDSDLYNMQIANYFAAEFSRQLFRIAQDQLTKAKEDERFTAEQPTAFPIESASLRALREGSTEEEILVRTMMLAKRAEEVGIEIPEDAITGENGYLRKVCARHVNVNQFQSQFRKLGTSRISFKQMVNQLRMELLAQRMRLMTASGVASTSPAMAYAYGNRTKRRAKIEHLAIYVKDFEDQVDGEPNESELSDLFEKGRQRFPNENSPEPAFKQRYKARFAYFKADREEFIQEAIASLSPEEIEKERLKRKKEKEEEEKKKKEEEAKKNEEESNSDEPKSDESQTGQSKSDADEKKESQDEDVGESNDCDDEKASKEDGGASEKKDGDEAKDKGNSKSGSDGEAKKSTDKLDDEKKPKTSDAEESNQNPKASDEKKAAGDKEEVGEEGDKQTEEEKELEDIKRALASPIAEDSEKKALSRAQREVQRYHARYVAWETQVEQKQDVQKPKPLNAKDIAKRHKLIYGEMPLVDITEADQYELGQASTFDMSGGRFRMVPFTEVGFVQDDKLYEPNRFGGFGTQYIYWKTEIVEGFVPEFDDVKDEVEEAWKKREAMKLALKDAEKRAKAVRDSDKTFKEVLSENDGDVTETNEFSWLTPGGGGNIAQGGGNLDFSHVIGVDHTGRQFMEDVFSLNTGEIGVTHNSAKTVFYIFRVIDDGKDEDLTNQFMTSIQPEASIQMVSNRDIFEFYTDWVDELQDEMDVEWQREPKAIQ